MRALRVEKVVVNIGVGEAGERRTKAEKVLQMITHQKPIATRAHSTNRDLGIREGQELGTKVTLRGEVAIDFLKRALATRENRMDPLSVDKVGNLAFGVPDYTDFAGMKYDPQIGIYGMDVCVEVGRAGWRVRHRARAHRSLGIHNRPTPDETRKFLAEAFGVIFIE
ncbi:MAG: 50S ribosomal protein L5 [Euryarchaeota archaeon]|nr:50S ribosomal protein L5 [Euryarchaeota archaeon]MDE1835726.1 50S ribosomal protein L5 [Euryarchaeota archaeon]MDE1880849.1 50S ribosomal protein L5 [Euryarchaeota archaeon]MDE2043917.1 50S ribosomal protein L5 [Thermoplasmata archaeon]